MGPDDEVTTQEGTVIRKWEDPEAHANGAPPDEVVVVDYTQE